MRRVSCNNDGHSSATDTTGGAHARREADQRHRAPLLAVFTTCKGTQHTSPNTHGCTSSLALGFFCAPVPLLSCLVHLVHDVMMGVQYQVSCLTQSGAARLHIRTLYAKIGSCAITCGSAGAGCPGRVLPAVSGAGSSGGAGAAGGGFAATSQPHCSRSGFMYLSLKSNMCSLRVCTSTACCQATHHTDLSNCISQWVCKPCEQQQRVCEPSEQQQ